MPRSARSTTSTARRPPSAECRQCEKLCWVHSSRATSMLYIQPKRGSDQNRIRPKQISTTQAVVNWHNASARLVSNQAVLVSQARARTLENEGSLWAKTAQAGAVGPRAPKLGQLRVPEKMLKGAGVKKTKIHQNPMMMQERKKLVPGRAHCVTQPNIYHPLDIIALLSSASSRILCTWMRPI